MPILSAGRNAFTLIEVLVALIVVSLSFPIFLSFQSNNVKNNVHVQRVYLADLVASNLSTELLSGVIKDVPKTVELGGYTWKTEITYEPSPLPIIKIARVSASYENVSSEKQVFLVKEVSLED